MNKVKAVILRRSRNGWTLNISDSVISDIGWKDKSEIYIHALGDGTAWLSQENMTLCLEEIEVLVQEAADSSKKAHLSVEESLKRMPSR